jgi:putative zinc finger/helix-turn-helix YgiT family protein
MPRISRRRSPTVVTCPACGSDKAQVVQRVEEFHEPDVRGDFKFEITLCDACGEEILSFEQAEAYSRAYTVAVARARNAPSHERFVDVRMRLGWTQPRMEEAFGIGPKTWGRWERGAIPPSGPALRLLWLAENNPSEFHRLVDAHTHQPQRSAKVVGSIAQQGLGSPAVGYKTVTQTVGRSGSGSAGSNGGGTV